MTEQREALADAERRQNLRQAQRQRVARLVLLVEGLALLALGISAYVVTAGDPARAHIDDFVLVFRVNEAYAVLLMVVGALAALSALTPRTATLFALAQAVGFTLLFVYGSARSANSTDRTLFNLNAADNFLHLGLAFLGLIMSMWLAARFFGAEWRARRTARRVPERRTHRHGMADTP